MRSRRSSGRSAHPIDLGQFMTLSAIALTAWRVTVRKGALTLVLMIATAVGSLLTARRTAVGEPRGGLGVGEGGGAVDGRAAGAAAVCVPLAAVLLASPIATVVSGDLRGLPRA